MKIKRSILEKIVREELANHIKTLREADEEKKDDKKKGPEVADAHSDKKEKEKGKKDDKDAAEKAPKVKPQDDPDNSADAPKGGKAKELPVTDEPKADKDLEKDVAKGGEEEDAEDLTGGEIADEVTGKTIQSITMEPKSKVMPGAQELVITFSQIPDPLRVLITKTGQVKFFFKGMHNEL